MRKTKVEAALRSWSSWTLALALAVALAPAGARGVEAGSASLQPEQIRTVQRALQDRGMPVAITGAWDEPTHAALADFQTASGLAATGQLDGATSRALGVDPYGVMPVGGTMSKRLEGNPDPAVDCNLNQTIDCRPGP